MQSCVVTAVLGENLVIPTWLTGSVAGFWGVNLVTLICAVLVFYGIMGYIRFKLR